MPNPQNPELRRSEEGNIRPRTELGPDPHDVGGETGPVPPDNQPGHHPEQEQDKPPADKFAEALGIRPDTEVGSETPPPSRPAKATAKKAAARTSASADTRDGGPSSAEDSDERSGTEVRSGGPTSEASAAAAATDVGAGMTPAGGPTETPETPPIPGPDAGGAVATAAMIAAAPRPPGASEPPEQAAREHHHALPDRQLPHQPGFVTPSGTPVTNRLLTWPLLYWGRVFKLSGDAAVAYGNALRRFAERISAGRD
jgi:hypothetical protein